MCGICGCEDHVEHVHADGTRHRHDHGHDGHHSHDGHHAHLELEARILGKNDALADRNRAWLAERRVAALNLMGAPGCGKTAILERTIRARPAWELAIIEGDQATSNDALRIRAAGGSVTQLNTGTGCHLDAAMVARGLEALNPGPGAVLVIENVGNLVCPALFRLGERRRVVVFSVTEGEDKPLKYPHMFRSADAILINKVDLLPHLEFDLERALHNTARVNPEATVLRVSARSGEGFEAWCAWLEALRTPA